MVLTVLRVLFDATLIAVLLIWATAVNQYNIIENLLRIKLVMAFAAIELGFYMVDFIFKVRKERKL